MAEMRRRENGMDWRKGEVMEHTVIDVLILSTSNAGFVKGEIPHGNLKQFSPSSVLLRFKTQEAPYKKFQNTCKFIPIPKIL
jgi:hypothetical protein